MKKLFSIVLSVMILLSAFPLMAVSADAEKIKLTDAENENVYYSYDATTKTLTISGTGAYTTDCGDSIYSGIGGLKFDSFYVFYAYRKITQNIVIEDGITAVGGGSFAYFKNLKTVQLPQTLTEIQPYAFYECYNLESISLPDSLEKIGFEAFRSCRKIKELNIPKSVKEIGGNFIMDTPELEKLTVDSENKYFTAENNVLYNKDKTKLLAVAPKQTEVTIPTSVTEISSLAFALSCVKEVVIPKSVTDFGGGTFYKSALEKITFENGIKINKITSFGREFGDDSAEYYGAFEECANLKRLIIPDTVETLGFRPFSGCSSLEYLYIGNKLEDFDSASFYNCKSLKKIVVNKNNKVFFIKKGALYEKTKWRKKSVIELKFVPVNKKSFKISKDTYLIGDFSFANGNIEKVTIPKKVEIISNGVFYNCQKLKSVTFAKNSKLVTLGYGAEDIFSNKDCCYDKPEINSFAMFYNCKKLKRVVLPDSLISATAYLFENCKRLKSLHFGKNFDDEKGTCSYDNYFEYVAKNCGSFAKITFSEKNKKYTSQNGIVYNKDKTEICYYPKNRKNKTFIIPKGVIYIASYVFKGCKYLKRVKFVYDPPKGTSFWCGENAFGKKTVLVKKNSDVHKSLKTYQKNFGCKVKIKFY